jgi:ABC-type methionine transport system ATPase subunit
MDVRRYISGAMTSVRVNLTGGPSFATEPVLWKLGKEFKVVVNILKANVDADMGWIQINLEGQVEDIQRATAWLMTTGLHVEAEQRAVGA